MTDHRKAWVLPTTPLDPEADLSVICDSTLQQLTDLLHLIARADPTVCNVMSLLHSRYPTDNMGHPSINLLRAALIAVVALHKDKLALQQQLLDLVSALPPKPIPIKNNTTES